MTDQPAQNSSYVDTYQPPSANTSAQGGNSNPFTTRPATPPLNNMPSPLKPAEPAPVVKPQMPAVRPTEPSSALSQTLENQNIFDLLGVKQASEQEKDTFLDELQQVIWEDFLENDVQLLITDAEMTQLKEIMNQSQPDELAKQEAMLVFLEKLIPDLEEIMLEKALELKADMVRERISGMREYHASQPDKLQLIDKAEAFLRDDQWRSVAETLNAIT